MDTLIQKIDILHPTLMEVLKYHGPLFIFALIFVNIGSILIISLDLNASDFNRKNIIDTVTQLILMILITTGIILSIGYHNYPKEHYTDLKLTELNELQNLIHVKDDKLTIDTLPEFYKYTNDKYDKNETQTFKIEHDKFFDSYKLVHKDNKITEITKEEYEELTKERTTNE